MAAPHRARTIPAPWLLAWGAWLAASSAGAQTGARVLLVREGPPSAADRALRDALSDRPGVRSVVLASASLDDILLAAGCTDLRECAPTVARAAGADLIVVRARASRGRRVLRVVDPAAPERVRTVRDAREVLPPAERPARRVQPLTYGLGAASLALLTGAAIAGALSLATFDSYAAHGGELTLEAWALLSRGHAEAATAGVLLGVGIATAAMAAVMLAFDLSAPRGSASLAIAPRAEGAFAEVGVRF